MIEVYGTSTQRNWKEASMWVPHFRPSSLVPPTGELQTVLLVPPPTPAKEFWPKMSTVLRLRNPVAVQIPKGSVYGAQ